MNHRKSSKFNPEEMCQCWDKKLNLLYKKLYDFLTVALTLSRMLSTRRGLYRAIRLTQEHSFVPIPYVSRLGQRRRCLHSAVKFNSWDLRTYEPECKPILKFALIRRYPTVENGAARRWKKRRRDETRRSQTRAVSALISRKTRSASNPLDRLACPKKTDAISL